MRLRTRIPPARPASAGTLRPATASQVGAPSAPEAASVATCVPFPTEKHRLSVCTICHRRRAEEHE